LKISITRKRVVWLLVALALAGFASLLFLPPHYPQLKPVAFDCLGSTGQDGRMVPLKLNPVHIYGLGLTYSTHIKETASPYDPKIPPVIFRKDIGSLQSGDSTVKMPAYRDVIDKIERVEPGLGKKVEKKYNPIPLLLDYEVELAFVLLKDVDWKRMSDPAYAPELGYFIANDLSARSIAILGEGTADRYEFWGVSKSFPGFLPAGKSMWVPDHQHANSVFSTVLTTTVNRQIRQKQSTTDMIYTPKQMLQFIAQKYPNDLPMQGDVVLTGTPGGVALQIPLWKARLGRWLGLGRFAKLSAMIRANADNPNFLKPGDEVTITGGILGQVRTRFIE
jgi:2-keto-4-pentenoate hydratase/2-oxohepta-3-ene-1,7-dioic acid hydratase in catechol pathway